MNDISTVEKLYFKVYQDKECIIGCPYYVDTPEGVMGSMETWKESNVYDGQSFPVLEPVYMTEQEFKNLPEFTGY